LSADSLATWREEFPTVEDCTYLVSHSLGAMPRRTAANLQDYADTWSRRGVRAWHEGWWELGRNTSDLLAPVLGVAPGTITMHQNVTVAMGIIASCFRYDGTRRKIVLTELEFPTNMYLFEGFARYGAEIVYVPSSNRISNDADRLLAAIDERTVLVPGKGQDEPRSTPQDWKRHVVLIDQVSLVRAVLDRERRRGRSCKRRKRRKRQRQKQG